MTLREWQQLQKPVGDLIRAASTVHTFDGLSPVSIGLAPNVWSLSDETVHSPSPTERSKLLYVNFTTTTDAKRMARDPNQTRKICRAQVLQTLMHNGFTATENTGTREYWADLRQHAFVASPEGNGVDCHRTYEALICGCVPIVEDNPHIRRVYGNVPILWTRDYSEITPAYLQAKLAEIRTRTYDFSRLLLSCLTQQEREQTEWRSRCWHHLTSGGSKSVPRARLGLLRTQRQHKNYL